MIGVATAIKLPAREPRRRPTSYDPHHRNQRYRRPNRISVVVERAAARDPGCDAVPFAGLAGSPRSPLRPGPAVARVAGLLRQPAGRHPAAAATRTTVQWLSKLSCCVSSGWRRNVTDRRVAGRTRLAALLPPRVSPDVPSTTQLVRPADSRRPEVERCRRRQESCPCRSPCDRPRRRGDRRGADRAYCLRVHVARVPDPVWLA